KGNVVFGIEQTVNLGPAGLEQRRHSRLGYFLFLHGLGELPCHHLLNGLGLRLFKDAFLPEEIIDARTHMFPAHSSNSFWRFRASVRSSSGNPFSHCRTGALPASVR